MNDRDIVENLLMEDNPRDAELTIRAHTKRNLASHLFHVKDGAEAQDFLFNRGNYEQRKNIQAPKAVLLDLNPPKVDGLEVLRILKSDERTHMIPVVIVTSSVKSLDMKEAYKLGTNSYVVKPVDFGAFN